MMEFVNGLNRIIQFSLLRNFEMRKEKEYFSSNLEIVKNVTNEILCRNLIQTR
jgi:hypothetical protein